MRAEHYLQMRVQELASNLNSESHLEAVVGILQQLADAEEEYPEAGDPIFEGDFQHPDGMPYATITLFLEPGGNDSKQAAG